MNYDSLPDWFLLFDVYDRKTAKFWSTRRRDELANLLDLSIVPELYKGKVTLVELCDRVVKKRSLFSNELLEGVVIRRESADWLLTRAKLVRSDFTQNINQHWSRREIEWNCLASREGMPLDSLIIGTK